MNVVEKIEYKGLTIKIVQDSDCSSPRDECNLGKILYKHNNRYTLGDEESTVEEMEAITNNDANICLAIYGQIQSHVYLKVHSSPSSWDDNQTGLIYVTKEQIRKEWKVNRISAKLMDTVLNNLKCEVETYNQWANGECYGYQVVDFQGEIIDSCWGFIGDTKYCIDEAKSVVDYWVKNDESGKKFADQYGIVTEVA